MRKIESYEKYSEIVNLFKQNNAHTQTNNFFMPEEVERFAGLERLYYDEFEGCLIIYLDEESHYHAVMYAVDGCRPSFVTDKPVFMRNIYRDGKRDKEAGILTKVLEDAGFVKDATTFNVRGYYEDVFPSLQRIERYVRALEKKGFSCIYTGPDEYSKVDELVLASGIIRKFHYSFKTDEERNSITPGCYLSVHNRDGKLCAANICDLKDGKAFGVAAAIIPEYKLTGLAPMLSYYRFNWMKEHDVQYVDSWIAENNEPSIKYHFGIGYKKMKRYADEWILNER